MRISLAGLCALTAVLVLATTTLAQVRRIPTPSTPLSSNSQMYVCKSWFPGYELGAWAIGFTWRASEILDASVEWSLKPESKTRDVVTTLPDNSTSTTQVTDEAPTGKTYTLGYRLTDFLTVSAGYSDINDGFVGSVGLRLGFLSAGYTQYLGSGKDSRLDSGMFRVGVAMRM